MNNNTLVIINPFSGKKKSQKFIPHLSKAFNQYHIKYDIQVILKLLIQMILKLLKKILKVEGFGDLYQSSLIFDSILGFFNNSIFQI